MKRRDTLLLRGFVGLVMFFFISGCSQNVDPLKEIDFEDTVEIKKPDISKRPEITICVGSMITPVEGYAFYKKILNYIGKKLDMKVNFCEKKTYAEVNALLKNGDIDVAFVCGGPYVKGHDEFGLELLVAPMVNGELVYYSYIIVSKNSNINQFEQLKGKVFAFTDPLSNTGKLVPTYMLKKLNETPQSFFSEYLFTYSHDNSIKAVAQGVVAGAAVDSLVWEYMKKKGCKYTKETKIIKVSDPYGIPPVVIRPGIDDDLRKKIKKTLLNMSNDKEGKQILEEMFIDRFVEVDDSNYNTIRKVKVYVEN